MHTVPTFAQLIYKKMNQEIAEQDFQLTGQPEEAQPRDIQMSELTSLADSLVEVDKEIHDIELQLSALKLRKKTI